MAARAPCIRRHRAADWSAEGPCIENAAAAGPRLLQTTSMLSITNPACCAWPRPGKILRSTRWRDVSYQLGASDDVAHRASPIQATHTFDPFTFSNGSMSPNSTSILTTGRIKLDVRDPSMLRPPCSIPRTGAGAGALAGRGGRASDRRCSSTRCTTSKPGQILSGIAEYYALASVQGPFPRSEGSLRRTFRVAPTAGRKVIARPAPSQHPATINERRVTHWHRWGVTHLDSCTPSASGHDRVGAATTQ